MKIDMNNVFIGTINKCIQYDTKTTFSSETYIGEDCIGSDSFGYIVEDGIKYKENAKLLKVTTNGYVDLDTLNSILDEIKVKSKITKDGGFYLNGLILSTSPHKLGCLYVDSSTLIQYKPLEQIKKPTVKKLKKTMLMDARIPGGIEW